MQGFLPLRSLETEAGVPRAAQKTHHPGRRVPCSKATKGFRIGLDKLDGARGEETQK